MIGRIENKIEQWLIEERLLIEKISDEKSNFNFLIINPIESNKTMNIKQPKGRDDFVSIKIEVKVMDSHIKNIIGLTNQERINFNFDLKMSFINQNVHYKLVKESGILHSFFIRKIIYEDGLSKDRLISEIYNVVHGALLGIMIIQKKFGIPEKELHSGHAISTNFVVPLESLMPELAEK